MSNRNTRLAISIALIGLLPAVPAAADAPFFSTGDPDGKMATATRPSSTGKFEIESADDFILGTKTSINGATFTGLLTNGAPLSTIGEVRVEIYRVFPNNSSFPPSGNVPSRVNSPSDVELEDRDTASGNLTFTDASLGSFSVLNSVQPGGIHAQPAQTTGGNGPLRGEEVQFDITFTTPFILPADHYFFVPQVEITDPNGNFFWLSAPRPITGGTGPFVGDLQNWTRDQFLDPDWLRVGQDIVGGNPFPTFNAAFSLTGSVVPEPSTWGMMLLGFAGLGFASYRHARKTGLATSA
jgi:hypothetical protein